MAPGLGPRSAAAWALTTVVAVCAASCGAGATSASDAGGGDASVSGMDAASQLEGGRPEDGARSDGSSDGALPSGDAALDAGCAVGATRCAGYGTVDTCIAADGGATWQSSACSAPAACVDERCGTSCVDECSLGDTRTTSTGTQKCQLWDVATRSVVKPGTGMEDRARLYDAYLRTWAMPVGQVAYAEYTAPDLATIAGYADQGDSAIFTGTYLAGEALRFKATQSPDALANVTTLVQTLHMLWNVAGSGSPGWLARFAAPANADPIIIDSSFSHGDSFDHFDGSWGGQTYDWKGHVSRDQYQGVIMGYALAYEVLSDETVRDLIRSDMVTFVTELMKTRTLCPTIDGTVCVLPLNVQYCVLTDKEPLDISISNGTETLSGVQEFMPVAFGLYPQPGTAIQLASAFEVALEVTANQPGWSTQHQTIQSFFLANVDSWLNVAKTWTYSRSCGNSYFANNIVFEPMFDLARLETDPTRKALVGNILAQNMWQNGVIADKNSWFAYIFAADTPASNPLVAPAIAMANAQLSQFTAPPRVHVAVTNNLPPDPSCPGNALDAIDVAQRVIGDFDWQRGSWQENDPGNPSEVFPGVDYLAAYWMARSYGYLKSDTPTECTRWLP